MDLMDKPRIVAIVQARMNSSRLPGKVLKEISGKPMLLHVINRAQRASAIDEIVVATTTDESDDAIESLCHHHDISVYRGSEFDVLDRYYQAAVLSNAEVVIRITADCPLIDPEEIDRTVDAFFNSGVDFAANRLPWGRNVPIGFDTEVCTFAVLEQAWQEAEKPFEREHVMPYIYDVPDRFKVLLVRREPDFGHCRWTVDTAQDLTFIKKIFDTFGGRDDMTYQEILDMIHVHPELKEINAGVVHKTFQDVDTRGQQDA
ncbi:MAG: glycosyltransferase family protein [Anaerolineaceae bacterium]|nr:glycosyltransferase family protein [Anaerolineaceae bacterium]